MTPRVRVAPLAAMILVGGLAALAAANCASPTQIIIDVRADSSLCAKINTGIAVTSPTNVDTANLSTYQDGCKTSQADGQSQVGALTITPSGADDAEVAVRIVAAVGAVANPDACGRKDSNGTADWSNCILARRTTRFAPGETVTITVRLTSDCVGQFCGANECNAGVCVRPEQIEDDGGTVLDADVRDFDGGSDAYVDAGDDACSHYCVGPGATCANNTCTIDCTGEGTACKKDVSCGGDFDCRILCGDRGSCTQVACTTTGKCNFDCTGLGAPNGAPHCAGISCRGSECTVACSNTHDTCDGVYLDGGKNLVTCEISGGNNPTCRDLHCASGGTTSCARTCATNGKGCEYGDPSTCTGNCDAWEDAGDGGN